MEAGSALQLVGPLGTKGEDDLSPSPPTFPESAPTVNWMLFQESARGGAGGWASTEQAGSLAQCSQEVCVQALRPGFTMPSCLDGRCPGEGPRLLRTQPCVLWGCMALGLTRGWSLCILGVHTHTSGLGVHEGGEAATALPVCVCRLLFQGLRSACHAQCPFYLPPSGRYPSARPRD